jgi:hypothetical protein
LLESDGEDCYGREVNEEHEKSVCLVHFLLVLVRIEDWFGNEDDGGEISVGLGLLCTWAVTSPC